MKNGRSPHFYLAIFWFLLTITLLCSGATPERPYYSETPNPRHIQNNDRLTAEYFNNQLNVIYNWAQRTNAELDNLLHNGLGVASLTVGVLNCTNKILSPVLELQASSQPPSPPYNGMIYFDSDLQRFRVYQENAWRDLSSNYIIDGNTLTNPLIINGYLESSYLYVNENASITKNLNVGGNASITKDLDVKGNIYSSGTAILKSLKVDKTFKVPTSASTTLGVGSIYYDTTAGKLKAYNGSSWDIVGKDITVDSAMSSTSTNPVQNKVVKQKFDDVVASLTYNVTVIDGRINTLNTNLLASLTQGLTQANASASLYASSAVTISEGYAQGLATSTYNAATAYTDALRTYVDSQDTKTLASATKLFVSDVATSTVNGTISVTKNGSTTNVAVKGLGDAAYANVGSFSPPITIDTVVQDSVNPVTNAAIKTYVDNAVSGAGKTTLHRISYTNTNEGFSYSIPSGVKYYAIFITQFAHSGGSLASAAGLGGVYLNGNSYLPEFVYSQNSQYEAWVSIPFVMTSSSITISQQCKFVGFLICCY